jgi:hypothetical protein
MGAPPKRRLLRAGAREGMSAVINESADLFEAPTGHRRELLGGDLWTELGARVQRLVERQRATQRAVNDLREAVAQRDRRIVELDAKLAAGERSRGELVARIDALLADVEAMMKAEAADPAEAGGR